MIIKEEHNTLSIKICKTSLLRYKSIMSMLQLAQNKKWLTFDKLHNPNCYITDLEWEYTVFFVHREKHKLALLCYIIIRFIIQKLGYNKTDKYERIGSLINWDTRKVFQKCLEFFPTNFNHQLPIKPLGSNRFHS